MEKLKKKFAKTIMRTRTGPARLKQFGPSPARIRLGPVDTSTVYVYVYIVYVYVVLTRVYAIMHRDVIIYAWEIGKRTKYYTQLQ